MRLSRSPRDRRYRCLCGARTGGHYCDACAREIRRKIEARAEERARLIREMRDRLDPGPYRLPGD